jgi:homoserine kinase type II
MAVFTSVTPDDLAAWLPQFGVGQCVSLKGIESGIENSNFFIGTERDGVRHEYVLTLFEKLSAEELPFYLGLVQHLEGQGIPCPGPVEADDGSLFKMLKGKPAAIVRRLRGQSHMQPTHHERALVGDMLARMHLAGQSFGEWQENPRGPRWWAATAPHVKRFLSPAQLSMLESELTEQFEHALDDLPRGPIHADLFRDNVMFDGAALGGFFDFYFAGCDCLLFDIAVCINDWCIDRDTFVGQLDGEAVQVFLRAYHAVRPLTEAEQGAWPIMLRAAALRFWLSRLYDLHLPRAGELIKPHDPTHFERILRLRREAASLPWL